MKVRIDNIYDDGLTLFTGNTLLNNDNRLADIMTHKVDLDLIASEHYGAREILRRNIKEDDTEVFVYDMTKINRHIYACMIENLAKYTMLLSTNEYSTNLPTNEYRETYVHGENVKTYDYDSRVDTTQYGDVDVEETSGQTSTSTTVGARENTESVTSFSSDTFNPTDKQTSASATDTTNLAPQTNTGHSERGNDVKTVNARTDTVTDDETTDTKSGYRDLLGNIEKQRRVFDKSVLDIIVNECINSITYSMYL